MAKGPVKGRADFWEPGDYNAACSICGRKRKASQMVQNWQGQWRCPEHNEPRQPQDFVRGIQDIQTPPWVQLETDIDVQICTFNGISAIPGVALPGCMLPGRTIWDQGSSKSNIIIGSYHTFIPFEATPGFAWPSVI